jgi:hypothetical protein
VPAVAALWQSAFERSQFIWLSFHASKRIPWTPSILRYFHAHFGRVHGLGPGIYLYKRLPRAAAGSGSATAAGEAPPRAGPPTG